MSQVYAEGFGHETYLDSRDKALLCICSRATKTIRTRKIYKNQCPSLKPKAPEK